MLAANGHAFARRVAHRSLGQRPPEWCAVPGTPARPGDAEGARSSSSAVAVMTRRLVPTRRAVSGLNGARPIPLAGQPMGKSWPGSVAGPVAGDDVRAGGDHPSLPARPKEREAAASVGVLDRPGPSGSAGPKPGWPNSARAGRCISSGFLGSDRSRWLSATATSAWPDRRAGRRGRRRDRRLADRGREHQARAGFGSA